MDTVVVDFESFYGDGYTLSSMTTEEYVRDPRFEAILCSFKINDGPSFFVSRDLIPQWLEKLELHKKAVISHHCMRGDVEVLSRKGWVRLDQLATRDVGEIAQWEPTTGEISFTAFTPIRSSYAGDLVSWDTTFHNCAYTPNHRMYYQTPNRRNWTASVAEQVEQMGPNNVYVPLSGWNVGGSDNLSADEARFMEAIRADGHILRTAQSAFVTFKFGKQRKVDRAQALMDTLDIPFTRELRDGFAVLRTRYSPLVNAICGKFTNGKQYGPWVLDLHKEAQAAIADEVQYWDGSIKYRNGTPLKSGGFAFSTVDSDTAEWLQILYHLNGYRCRGKWCDNNRGLGAGNNRPLFVAGVRKTTRAKLVVPAKRVPFVGDVYCVTVPTGAFVVRSNGRVHITGNSHFDCLILSHHYGVKPKIIFDTLPMARAVHGGQVGLSLAKLAKHYGLPDKGTEVQVVRNMRYKDFSPAALKRYGEYSCLDSDIEYALFHKLLPHFNRSELEIMDRVCRMFTEPVMQLDVPMLKQYVEELRANKTHLLLKAGVQLADVMSNEKFAEVLRSLGIDPPMKISPTTGKLTYAFARTDIGIQALEEHPDETVQALIAARLKNKSTLAEKRAERMIGMQSRGAACIYLKYSGASGTHRFSGGDKMNWQNLTRGSALRDALMAPDGCVTVVGDSSNIEARLVDWLAEQDDMVEVYKRADAKLGPDVYCVQAEMIYKKPVKKEDEERRIGKEAILGLGFGMGASRFIIAVRGKVKGPDGKPLVLSQKFAQEVVDIYRESRPKVKLLWKRGGEALKYISKGVEGVPVDPRGIVRTCKDGVVLPNGLKILFPHLQYDKKTNGEWGGEWSFWNGKMREGIFDAKFIENVVQALARVIVVEQSRLAARELGSWVHSVHDEAVLIAPEFEAPYVLERLLWHMRQPLDWCKTLPLNSEGGFHKRYGQAKG